MGQVYENTLLQHIYTIDIQRANHSNKIPHYLCWQLCNYVHLI